MHTNKSYTKSNLFHQCFFLWADIFLSWTSSAETHMQSSCPVSSQISKALGQAQCTEGLHTHRVNLTFLYVSSLATCTQNAGTGGLPSELHTRWSSCPYAWETKGHARSNQNDTMYTEKPGNFLPNTMSTLRKEMAYSAKGYSHRLPCQSQFSFVSVLYIFLEPLFLKADPRPHCFHV